jgi:putative aldouronate transport system permease protein
MKRWHRIGTFDVVNISLLLLLSFTMLYPFINILAMSLNEAMDTQAGGIYFFPRKFTLQSYIIILKTPSLVNALVVTVSRTVIGTLLTVFCTAMFAFVMTRRDFIIYKPLKVIFFIALFMGGGSLIPATLIPTYMLYRNLDLIDRFLVYILPVLINIFFALIMRTYFMQLPAGLTESAMLDGANELVVFFRIIFPLSAPIVAYIALNAAVYQWNAWQDTLFFTNGGDLKPMQFVMMEVMLKSQATQMLSREMLRLRQQGLKSLVDPQSVKMAITILVTLPILFIYPFLQKYFIKGILIGSMKG